MDEKKALGIKIPPAELEALDDWCTREALVKWRVVLAGLKLIRIVPQHLRHKMITDDWAAAQSWINRAEVLIAEDDADARQTEEPESADMAAGRALVRRGVGRAQKSSRRDSLPKKKTKGC